MKNKLETNEKWDNASNKQNMKSNLPERWTIRILPVVTYSWETLCSTRNLEKATKGRGMESIMG